MAAPLEDIEFQAGERVYVRETKNVGSIAKHIARYEFALSHIPDGAAVLDAASGSGYGSEMLSHKARQVVGLEISDHALDYARAHHQNPKIDYRKADLNTTLDIPSESFDVVVSFETLEHLAGQDRFVSELHRVLKPGGTLILSTPDRWVSSWLAGFQNQFHHHELTKNELRRIIGRSFPRVGFYGQTRWRGRRAHAVLRSCYRKGLPPAARRVIRVIRPRHRSGRSDGDGHIDPGEYRIESVAPGGRSEHYYQIVVAER